MSVVVLDENKWQKILAFLQTEDRVNIRKEAGCKRFIEAVLWMALVPLGVTVFLLITGYNSNPFHRYMDNSPIPQNP